MNDHSARNKEKILAKLKALEVTSVVVEYSGSGDGGQIDGVTIEGGNEPAPSLEVEEAKSVWVPDGDLGGKWEANIELVEKSLADAIEDFCYDLIEEHHPGYENNDGGDGRFSFNIQDGTIHWTHNDFYTETDTTERTI